MSITVTSLLTTLSAYSRWRAASTSKRERLLADRDARAHGAARHVDRRRRRLSSRARPRRPVSAVGRHGHAAGARSERQRRSTSR
jgi:hypothetical protein